MTHKYASNKDDFIFFQELFFLYFSSTRTVHPENNDKENGNKNLESSEGHGNGNYSSSQKLTNSYAPFLDALPLVVQRENYF